MRPGCAIGSVLRTLGHVAAGDIPPGAPVCSYVYNGENNVLTITITGEPGVTNILYGLESNGSIWDIIGTRSGDGDIEISNLERGVLYYFVVVSSRSGLYSLPSIVIRQQTYFEGENFEDSGERDLDTVEHHIRTFLPDNEWSLWYRRRTGDKYPQDGVPVGHELTGNDSYQGNPYEKVEDNVSLWEPMGSIPLLITAGPFSLADAPEFQYYLGRANGIIPYNYDIKIGDHFLDSENREWKCRSIERSPDKMYKVVDLLWLPSRRDVL